MSAEIIHGDCLDVLASGVLAGVDAVVSDPPYGISHRRGSAGNRGKGLTLGTAGISGDDGPFNPAPWLQFPKVLLWGANWYADKLPAGRWLIWDKQEHGGSGDFSEAEIAWSNTGKALKFFRHMWLGVQRASEVGQRRQHPTQKPVALMSWCIGLLKLPPNSLIVDPYCGSGTTGIAAVLAGHRFIGVECDAAHVATARRRIADAQAQMALGVA